MKKKDDRPKQAAPLANTTGLSQAGSGHELRRQAEEIIRKKAAQSPLELQALSPEKAMKTLHELQVNQIELKMQNEELRRAQEELEVSRAKYFDLFDLAPVGYLTLEEKGLIMEANLTAAQLLGVERSSLVNHPLTRFIFKEALDIYHMHLKRLFESGTLQTFELRMIRQDGSPFWTLMEITPVQAGEGESRLCKVVMSDINKRKQAEEELRESERRLSFETLLADLSARCINLAEDQVDAEIENALRKIMEIFQVDRCALLEGQKDKAFVRVTHAAYSEGVEQVSGEINLAELFPWSYEQLIQGKHLNITRVEDFPEEALRERQSFAAMGIKSTLSIPLSFGGRISRIIVIQRTRQHQTWPEEYIPRLSLLGEIFVNALERKENRLQLEEQLRFEMLLTEISGRFVNLPTEQIDSEIEDAQRRVCECLELDLSALWQWSMEHPRIVKMTHIYRPLGGPPLPDPMYAHEHFPWCQEQVEAGRIIVVSCIEDVPAEAARDQETWRYLGIKTTLTFPLSLGGGPIIGALSFNTMRHERTWPEPLVKRLQLVAQMFTNALVRKQTDTALCESEERLSLTTEAVGAGLWIMEVDTGKVWVSPKSRELFDFAQDQEITYESYFRVIHPEDRDRVHQEVQHSLQSGENLLCDYRIVLPDGSIRWIVARGQRYLKSTGKPDRIMGLSLDITERKGMELKLSESQTLLTSLFNSTSDLIWSVDPEHFGLLTFNRGLSEYFLNGIGLHIEVGMTPDDLLPTQEYAQKWYAFYRRALEEGSFTTEYQAYAEGRTLRLNLNTLRRGDVVFGISVFGQDITKRKQMENQLQERLQEIERLREKLEKENVYLREETKLLSGYDEIVGDSTAIKKVLAQAERVAPTDSTVLILGETGTGKELLARAIHNLSSRKDRTLVTVNCASLPPTLIESELFGREKGAYTGALTRMTGRFETADGSTLFLDEIGELPFELQSKLLRVLEHGIFERLGSTRTIKINVRIIAATNRDLSQDVGDGRFRKDLYYRLNVFPITIPPLRERKEDIQALIWSFVRDFEKSMGKRIDRIPKKSMNALIGYHWPGNIRELKNVIEHAMIISTTTSLHVLPPAMARQETPGAAGSLEDMERKHILDVLERTNWRISGKNSASEILGMKRTTLQSKMKLLGITRPASP